MYKCIQHISYLTYKYIHVDRRYKRNYNPLASPNPLKNTSNSGILGLEYQSSQHLSIIVQKSCSMMLYFEFEVLESGVEGEVVSRGREEEEEGVREEEEEEGALGSSRRFDSSDFGYCDCVGV